MLVNDLKLSIIDCLLTMIPLSSNDSSPISSKSSIRTATDGRGALAVESCERAVSGSGLVVEPARTSAILWSRSSRSSLDIASSRFRAGVLRKDGSTVQDKFLAWHLEQGFGKRSLESHRSFDCLHSVHVLTGRTPGQLGALDAIGNGSPVRLMGNADNDNI